MGVLLLKLSGPLQAWGDSSRFTVRRTRREPTKSGVVGLIAAALGRTRDQPLDDISALEFGVRIDQPGEMIRDFQTEQTASGDPMPLSQRYYLADAKFLVALGGSQDQLDFISKALSHPIWPLYLGRRSCPPDVPIVYEPQKGPYDDVRAALSQEPWMAAPWYRARCGGTNKSHVFPDLEIACDAREGEVGEDCADVPLSFGAVRAYASRRVVRFRVPNPDRSVEDECAAPPTPIALEPMGSHDPMGFF